MKLADAHLHLFRRGYSPRYGSARRDEVEVEVYEAVKVVRRVMHDNLVALLAGHGRRLEKNPRGAGKGGSL
jgi:hypothetical protein